MNYGLPYKGSKNKLATRIVDLLPRKKHFYDLFCGGCAVTHAAMLSHKWDDFTINDLNWQCPTLFVDALNGKYKDDTRWISREDFFRLKDTDPYVAFVWSFGNNLRDYIYSREIEPLKKAIHYALYFGDYSFAKELGHDLSFLDAIKEQDKRYSAVRHYFQQFGRMQLQSHEGGTNRLIISELGGVQSAERRSQPTDARIGELQSMERANRLSGFAQKKKELEHFYLEHYTRHQRLLQTDSSRATRTTSGLAVQLMWGVKSIVLQAITHPYTLSRTA